ncbi:MAG: serine hydrolase [Candidatus Omnitrophota bacterium]
MRKIFFLKVILVLIIGISFTYFTINKIERIIKEKKLLTKRKLAWRELKEDLEDRLKSFKGKAGILIKDLKTNWVISFNEKETFPAASLIKVPIMLACFEAVKEKRLSLDEVVKLKSSQKTSGSGILKNLPAGKTFTIERLIELMITVSDNTATNILIEKLGFDYLNNYFQRIGLKNTKLLRKMMDFQQRDKGIDNFTNAKDIAYVFEYIYRRRAKENLYQKGINFLQAQKYRDRISAKLPSAIKVAHKTGLERKACHDAGIIFGAKGDFLIVVLTDKRGGARIAKQFIADISLRVYNYYSHF